eukprot:COSAG02_NODE_4762_length_5013_cov_5.204314_7_plen_71_part_00
MPKPTASTLSDRLLSEVVADRLRWKGLALRVDAIVKVLWYSSRIKQNLRSLAPCELDGVAVAVVDIERES